LQIELSPLPILLCGQNKHGAAEEKKKMNVLKDIEDQKQKSRRERQL
jgi:hypothetical protein